MKSKTKILVAFNIFLILILWLGAETYCYKYFLTRVVVPEHKIFQFHYKDYAQVPAALRFPDENETYKKPSLLTLGCSYTQGASDKSNISARLTKDTGHWTYNFGQSGFGPALALTALLGEDEKPEIPKDDKPDKIIYTYMFHHPQRWEHWNFYNLYRKMEYIPFQKYNIFYNSYIYQYYKNIELDRYFNDDFDFKKRMNLFYMMMRDIKKQTEKLYPGSKFYFMIYSDINYDLSEAIRDSLHGNDEAVQKLFDIMYSDEFRKEMEKIGLQVLTTEELIGRKMDKTSDRIPNDYNRPHPSDSAWDEILPPLEKVLFPEY